MKAILDDHQEMIPERVEKVEPLYLPLQSASEKCKLEYIQDVLPYGSDGSDHYHYVSPSICLTVRVMGKEVLLMARSAIHGHEIVRIARKNFPRPGILTKLFHRPWPPLKKLLESAVSWKIGADIGTTQHLSVASFTRIKGPKLADGLLALDRRLIAPQYKVGLVYATASQNDFEAMLGNHPYQVPPTFWQFIRWLAQEINLRGWTGFAGGLDTRDDSTGRTAFYTRWQQYEIMFHAAPLIPCPDYDERRVMRKRHVSNDMVLVVFQESRTDHFAFDTIISRQTHIVILVTPIATKKDDQPSIRVQLFKRCGCAVIPAYARWDQEPLVIGNEDDRNRFLATVIQAEWASYQCPDVAPLLAAYRLMILQDLHSSAVQRAAVIFGALFKVVGLVARLYFAPPTNWSKYGAKKGTWAVVTGSTDGIGKEFAIQLGKKGFNLILIARNKEKLATTKEQIAKECGGSKGTQAISIETVQFDFSDATRFDQLAKMLSTKFDDISVLVNNVGVSHEHPEYFEEADPSALDTIITVNCLNTVRLTRALLPAMIENHRGLILNLGSFSGETPIPLLQTYSASKAFVRTWSIALASEVRAKGVDVQLLNTYFVVSNMSKFRRATWMIPSPTSYVKAALRVAGQGDFLAPYGPHALLGELMKLIPGWLLLMVNRAQMRKTRQHALQKKATKTK